MPRDLPARKPVLDPGVAAVLHSPDEVGFETDFWDGPTHRVHDEDEDGTVRRLVEMLDGSRTVAEIVAELGDGDGDEIQSLVAELFELGVVRDASRPRSRYARLCSADTETGAVERDTELPSVLVVGDGTLGTWIATTLADAGVENVTLARASDTPEGNLSSEAAEETSIDSASDLSSLTSDADIAVVATERPGTDLLDAVNRAASSDTPWLPARANGSVALVGPLVVPDATGCYECYQTRSAANASDPEAVRTFRAGDATASIPWGLRHVVVGMAVDGLARFVCYGDENLVGHVARFDLRTGTIETNEVLPVPNCPVCSSDAESESTIPTAVDGETHD